MSSIYICNVICLSVPILTKKGHSLKIENQKYEYKTMREILKRIELEKSTEMKKKKGKI